jgi:hypothetical protein
MNHQHNNLLFKPTMNPVTFEPLHQAQRVRGDLLRLVPELELRRKPRQVQRGIDEGQLDLEESQELEKGHSEDKHVGVEHIRKVNQHVLNHEEFYHEEL